MRSTIVRNQSAYVVHNGVHVSSSKKPCLNGPFTYDLKAEQNYEQKPNPNPGLGKSYAASWFWQRPRSHTSQKHCFKQLETDEDRHAALSCRRRFPASPHPPGRPPAARSSAARSERSQCSRPAQLRAQLPEPRRMLPAFEAAKQAQGPERYNNHRQLPRPEKSLPPLPSHREARTTYQSQFQVAQLLSLLRVKKFLLELPIKGYVFYFILFSTATDLSGTKKKKKFLLTSRPAEAPGGSLCAAPGAGGCSPAVLLAPGCTRCAPANGRHLREAPVRPALPSALLNSALRWSAALAQRCDLNGLLRLLTAGRRRWMYGALRPSAANCCSACAFYRGSRVLRRL